MKRLTCTFALAATLAAGGASAATFSPSFADYAGFPSNVTQFNVDAAANAFFSSNYGITVDNAYLYRDARDLIDGVGVANGAFEQGSTPNVSGRINFLDTTDFVTIDYFAIRASTYSAFTSDGTLVGSFSVGANTSGQQQIAGGNALISYLTFTGDSGFSAISGLIYNYDGITGGGNTDLPTQPVPEPETYALMLAGLGLVVAAARRRRRG